MPNRLEDVIARMDAKILGTPAAPVDPSLRESEFKQRVRALRLPKTIRDFFLAGVDEHGRPWFDSHPYARSRHWLGERKRLIVLSGVPGTGKTCAAARALADLEATSAAFLTAPAFCEMAAKKRGHGYRGTRALVLDNLGIEADGAAFEIDKLIFERHGNNGTTLITTELDGDAFRARYSAATASRLHEIGKWIDCKELLRRQ